MCARNRNRNIHSLLNQFILQGINNKALENSGLPIHSQNKQGYAHTCTLTLTISCAICTGLATIPAGSTEALSALQSSTWGIQLIKPHEIALKRDVRDCKKACTACFLTLVDRWMLMTIHSRGSNSRGHTKAERVEGDSLKKILARSMHA